MMNFCKRKCTEMLNIYQVIQFPFLKEYEKIHIIISYMTRKSFSDFFEKCRNFDWFLKMHVIILYFLIGVEVFGGNGIFMQGKNTLAC